MNNYENLIDTLLENRYKLKNVVGIGGMAVVFEAEDIMMNRPVAIKMLKTDTTEDEQAVKRFVNESKAVAMLSHPNIVNIYDVSVSKNDCQYIVMEYIDGITLKDYIVGKGKLPWREAVVYIEQILKALAHAHSKGIIHRDVKPQNVILLRNGVIKVTDFGIAKLPGSEPLTMTDKAIGTVHYISPEQASGGGEIFNTSDIYSAGVMFYEMITGKLPFEATTAIKIAMMQISDTPQDPRTINPEIPKGLSQIILKAMNKNPEERYRTSNEMLKQIAILKANPATVFSNSLAVTPIMNTSKSSASSAKTELTTPGISGVTKQKKVHTPEKPRRRNSRQGKSMLPIISGVTLAFLIILAISGINIVLTLLKIDQQSTSESVKIPNYEGKLYDEAMKEDLKERKIEVFDIIYAPHNTYAPNVIISQTPKGGETKRLTGNPGKVDITFTISLGKDYFELPDVTYIDYREAENLLSEKGLKTQIIRQSHDSVPYGYVIETEPGAGNMVAAGDTVQIIVSDGQTVIETLMPSLIGSTEQEARKVLSDHNLVLKEINYEHSNAAAGTIIYQSITPTKKVPEKSTKVTLTVSLGPIPTSSESTQSTEPIQTIEPTT